MRTSTTSFEPIRTADRGLTPRAILVGLLSLFLGTGASSSADHLYELAVRAPHVWRGITLRDFAVANSSVTFQFLNGFAVQLWFGLDLGDGDGRRGEVQEIDIDLSRTWDLESARLTAGIVALIFPGGIDPTGEIYFKWQSKRFLSPQVNIFYNFDLLHDVFAEFTLGHRWREASTWSPAVSGQVAYSGADYARFFGGSKAGLHHWGLQLDLDYQMPRKNLKLRIGYSRSIDEEVLPDQPSRFWGGIYWSFRKLSR